MSAVAGIVPYFASLSMILPLARAIFLASSSSPTFPALDALAMIISSMSVKPMNVGTGATTAATTMPTAERICADIRPIPTATAA
ncbi:hypothetical protein D3C87_2086810 [compost metagenome]